MNWYTTLLFPGGVYQSSRCFSEMTGYTTLLFLGGVYQSLFEQMGGTGIQPCYFWVVYTRHRYSVPQSAGRHLSHNKPANRVFLLPRRPCISTGVNSGYTVRTRFYFLGNVCNHCTLYLLAIGL